MSRLLYQVHIADGFVDDCEELIHLCSKVETLTYGAFCELWKDVNFASIYQGRTLAAEIAELSEEVIHIAKRYLVANTSNFEETVAGLFLVYCLVNLQPFKGFASLRLTPDDMPAIKRIEVVARREKRLDVLYILGSILIRGPCQFHAMPREHGLELSLRKYTEGYTGIDKQGVRPKGVFARQNAELDMLRELKNIGTLYADAKAKISNGKDIDRNLNYFDTNLPAELNDSLKNIINGITDDDNNKSDRGGSSDFDHCNKVQAIKQRAMKNVVNPIKHLTGVEQKRRNRSCSKKNPKSPNKTTDTPTPNKSPNTPDIKSKPGRVKSGSPRKPLATGFSQKAKKKSARSRNRFQREKKGDIENNLSESSEVLSLASDDNMDQDIAAEESTQNESENYTAKSNLTEIDINENSTEVEVGLIPVVIHTEGKGIEIEILDHYVGNSSILEEEPVSAKNKIKNLPEVSLVRVLEGENSTGTKSENLTNASENFKKPTVTLTKREKRELKKPILKSKFKKMGILPVANFDDSKHK